MKKGHFDSKTGGNGFFPKKWIGILRPVINEWRPKNAFFYLLNSYNFFIFCIMYVLDCQDYIFTYVESLMYISTSIARYVIIIFLLIVHWNKELWRGFVYMMKIPWS